MEKPRGRQPHALGESPISPSESHRDSALLLPVSGCPQHPYPWQHSTQQGTLPVSSAFPTLSICPMARNVLPSRSGVPRPCTRCLPCAAASGHRLVGAAGSPHGAALGAMVGSGQGLEHSAEQGDMRQWYCSCKRPLGRQGRAPHAAPAQPPAQSSLCPPGPPGSGPGPGSAACMLPGGDSGLMPGFHGNSS